MGVPGGRAGDGLSRARASLARWRGRALWTLRRRAVEAARPDAVIRDPLALSLVERIDFPFAERFGRGEDLGQWQALRALAFDREVRRFAAARPGGTVVALGEGLETGFWRADDGRIRWLTVDLPEVIALRERLLPPSPRRRAVAGYALGDAWLDTVAPVAADGVLVTAQGLLMYLEPAEVHSPPWRWGLDAAQERALAAIPGVGHASGPDPRSGCPGTSIESRFGRYRSHPPS